MKSKSLTVDGTAYTVHELSMEEGFPLINTSDGALDIPGLIRTATRVNGEPAKEGQISLSVAMKLMPLVLELNTFMSGAEGNA